MGDAPFPDDTLERGTPPTPGGGARPAASGGAPRPDDGAAPPALGPKLVPVRVLGRGGMGVVWEVHHTTLEKRMAVKLMKRDCLRVGDFERFRREARAANDIDHPNILRVHDFDWAQDGTPFILMELLEGEDLRAVLERDGRLPLARVVELLRGVAEALDRAHAQGIVHRDLKPANLFLTQSGVLKVLDFGICQYRPDEVARLTQDGTTVGTPRYMAPEQLRGAPASPRTDVHALGAIAFELLCGAPPFGEATLFDLVARTTADVSPRFEADRPDLPPAVGDALARALAVEPAQRYASAGAFVAALDVAQGRTRAASPPATPGDGRSRRRRRWRLAALAAAAALAATATLVALSSPSSPDGPPAHPAVPGAPAGGGTGGTAPTASPGPPTAARWPDEVRLLVAPFASSPERETDEILWPLVDRMVLNALEPDERVLRRVRRIDPARVAEEAARRELGATLGREDLLELAAALDANVLLGGALRRERGRLRLDATLWAVDEQAAVTLRAEDVQLPAVAAALAGEVRARLWPAPPAPLPPERLAALLVTRPEAADLLAQLGPATPAGERRALLRRLADVDPDASFGAWLRFLERPLLDSRMAALAAAAAKVPDPELRQLFTAVADRAGGKPACEGLDADALGERYPETIGPLAAAVCAWLRGDQALAERKARAAFDRKPLRGLARPLLSKVLFYAKTCDDLIPLQLEFLELLPEDPAGWGGVAAWQVRCERPEDARRSLAVARVLLGDHPAQRRYVAMLGATANLGLLDVAGAREWIDVLERARRPVERSVPYYLVTSQAYYLQGRYREGLARVREGRQVLAAHPDDDWSMLVAADVWMSVHLGDIEGAERAVAAFGAVFRETRDPGNRYMAGMLDLALDRLRGRVDDEALVARMDALGGAVEAALGDLGRAERHAQECLLLSHLAPDRSAAVLRRADASNVFLGGCRLRQAERLLAGGEAAAAADEFRRALTDILWARFVYAEYVPAALLGLARARQALGRREEARAGYQVLLTNYARADRRVPEVEAAMEALGGLP